MVVIITTQSGIATGGHDFKDTLCQPQDRDIEGATTQIVDSVNAFAGVVQAVGYGSSGGFVDQSQHIQAGQLGRIFGGLALGIVKVGRDCDDRTIEVIVERVFRTVSQRSQNLGAHLHGRLFTQHRLQAQHTCVIHKTVGQLVGPMHIGQAAAHETLDGGDGVLRVTGQRFLRRVPHLATTIGQIAHDGGQNDPALVIGQTFGHAVAHSRHQRMGRSQIYAHGDAPRMRVGRLTGLGYL